MSQIVSNLSLIVAMDQNGAIGKDNALLCYLPADLKYFKEKTTGHPIIMGRRTFESLPNGALPNRRNIVISRNRSYRASGAEVCGSLEECIRLIKDESESFVIGGGQIYSHAMEYVSRLYITRIQHLFEGADTFFPKIKEDEWRCCWSESHQADAKNPYGYTFQKYIRLL